MNRTIESALHANGNLIAEAQRKGASLSGADRRIILRNRDRALAAGYCDSTIRALEWEGEQGMKGVMPFPVSTRYIGSQDISFLGLSLRMYNVEGDHRLNNSTVGVSALLANHLIPTDIGLFRALLECAKEKFVMTSWWIISVAEAVKAKLGARP